MSGKELITVDCSIGATTGFIDSKYPRVAQFLGVPFAEPPTGPRRWLPPVPKAPVASIDATEFGPSCPQVVDVFKTTYNTDVREFVINDATSEDCLSLCIWTPVAAVNKAQGTASALPVIVWVTGGAYLGGGNTVPYQNPAPWVESSQRHIVVSINYRLNIFGFPNAAGLPLTEQNLGTLDQRLGLEWVHKHIGAFGGDPDRLTYWGQSAGARSVDCHGFSYADNSLVRGVILNSGAALLPLNVNDPTHSHFSFVAKSLGFPGGDAAAELDFMRQQPAERLTKFREEHTKTGAEPILRFQPIVDGRTELECEDYEARLRDGRFSKVPVIIGTTADEGNSLVPYNPESCDVEASRKLTKMIFDDPADKTISLRSKHTPIFRYLYQDPAAPSESSFPNISPRPWMRAYHSSELPLIFGTHDLFRGESTEQEYKLSRAWQDLYLAFAEDGAEGLRAKGWLDVSQGKAVIFGSGDQGWELVDSKELTRKE
ncbi:hypothetical protein ASPZODRAFT_64683 [Penicilliopsis zonata CBS 506.65]|uniref:Carboxylesterase type B domain-containing protein n=1 Tax=Penicilliopsis zonata CBS 506.65 TaxID=1073090 RepID=A0A1L9SI62_9EURO|nr:hypothetical protein ASPZODRAFT_64683 [Penicilliopsis zonata CBS 506.65]OJJ46827.1 hypothetical protein ASPZODRAFT_64683 [Penicilliopsis zonata CBS 506.65]